MDASVSAWAEPPHIQIEMRKLDKALVLVVKLGWKRGSGTATDSRLNLLFPSLVSYYSMDGINRSLMYLRAACLTARDPHE